MTRRTQTTSPHGLLIIAALAALALTASAHATQGPRPAPEHARLCADTGALPLNAVRVNAQGMVALDTLCPNNPSLRLAQHGDGLDAWGIFAQQTHPNHAPLPRSLAHRGYAASGPARSLAPERLTIVMPEPADVPADARAHQLELAVELIAQARSGLPIELVTFTHQGARNRALTRAPHDALNHLCEDLAATVHGAQIDALRAFDACRDRLSHRAQSAEVKHLLWTLADSRRPTSDLDRLIAQLPILDADAPHERALVFIGPWGEHIPAATLERLPPGHHTLVATDADGRAPHLRQAPLRPRPDQSVALLHGVPDPQLLTTLTYGRRLAVFSRGDASCERRHHRRDRRHRRGHHRRCGHTAFFLALMGWFSLGAALMLHIWLRQRRDD